MDIWFQAAIADQSPKLLSSKKLGAHFLATAVLIIDSTVNQPIPLRLSRFFFGLTGRVAMYYLDD